MTDSCMAMYPGLRCALQQDGLLTQRRAGGSKEPGFNRVADRRVVRLEGRAMQLEVLEKQRIANRKTGLCDPDLRSDTGHPLPTHRPVEPGAVGAGGVYLAVPVDNQVHARCRRRTTTLAQGQPQIDRLDILAQKAPVL